MMDVVDGWWIMDDSWWIKWDGLMTVWTVLCVIYNFTGLGINTYFSESTASQSSLYHKIYEYMHFQKMTYLMARAWQGDVLTIGIQVWITLILNYILYVKLDLLDGCSLLKKVWRKQHGPKRKKISEIGGSEMNF